MNVKMKYGHCINCGAILSSKKCAYCDTIYIIENEAPITPHTQSYQERLPFNGYEFIMEHDSNLDIDIFALLLKRDHLTSSEDVIFYNNPKSNGISLNERYGSKISINLPEISYGINKIVLGFSIYDAYNKHHCIGMIQNGKLTLRDAFTNKDIVCYENICEKNSLGCNYVFAELIRELDGWKVKMVDNVVKGYDLNDVLSYY